MFTPELVHGQLGAVGFQLVDALDGQWVVVLIKRVAGGLCQLLQLGVGLLEVGDQVAGGFLGGVSLKRLFRDFATAARKQAEG